VLDGANLDDLGDHRPGLQAAAERGVRHVLVEAELGKADIRAASRALGLPTWDRPASPCLSSRFPYGTRITLERLERVQAAERFLVPAASASYASASTTRSPASRSRSPKCPAS